MYYDEIGILVCVDAHGKQTAEAGEFEGMDTQQANKAIAAKVNLRLVPLSYILRTGDQVEIITAEDEQPKPEWLAFLKTSKARKIVSDFFRTDKTVKKTPPAENRREEKPHSVTSLSDGCRYVIASCCNPIP